MSYRLKVIIFVLAINIIALALGYLLRGMALYWFIPVIFLMRMGGRAAKSALAEANESVTLKMPDLVFGLRSLTI